MRNTRTDAAATAQRPHQYAVAKGEDRKSAPVHSWCGSASPTPR